MELIRITTKEAAEAAADEILAIEDGLVAVDTETAAKEDFIGISSAALHPTLSTMRLAQFAADTDERAWVFDLWSVGTDAIKRIIEGRRLFAHNAVFEYKHFLEAGIQPLDLQCTMVLRQVQSADKASLLDTVKELLDYDLDKSMQKSGWHVAELTEAQWQYAGEDAYYTARIIQPLIDRLVALPMGPEAYKMYSSIIPLTAEMEWLGVPFDAKAHKALAEEWADKAERGLAKLIAMMDGANPASVKQVSDWLKTQLKKTVLKKWPVSEKTGHLQITAETMAAHVNEHEAIKTYLEWKSYQKLDGTYGKGIQKEVNPVTGNIHPSWRILGARTGRFSCQKPNLQNPPREGGVREMVRAPEGYMFLDADLSQIELRIAATLSNDLTMLGAYEDGKDLHKITAAAISGVPLDQVTKEQRQAAKAVNFGLLYGGGAKMLRDYALSTYGVEMTLSEAEHARETFFKTYSRFHQWQDETTSRAAVSLRSNTASGYIRNFAAEGRTKNDVYTVSLNTPVQGSGAEVLIRGLVRTDQAFKAEKLDARIIAHVHDQIVCLVKESDLSRAAKILEESMIAGAVDVLPKIPTRNLVEATTGKEWSKDMAAYEGDHQESEVMEESQDMDAVTQAFVDVNEMGYRVIAMPAGTKKPIEENWGNKPTTRLPEGYKNLGMIHGWNKTVCIDLDNLEQSIVAFESLGIDIQQLCSHAPAWHGNPHNRIKYLFKIPEGASIRREVLNVHGRTVFELRGDTNGKQLQDVIPPSVHPDGYSYQWVNPLVPLAELPELPSELLKVWNEFDGIEAGLMAILGDYSKEIANYERMGGGNTSDKTRALIAEYNNRHPVTELLERAGYKPPKRGQTKWLCPTSESGTPGVWISDDERLCYSHHGSDVLGDGKAHDAFDVLRICLHDGSFDEAKQEAFEEIGDVGDEVPVITPDELAQGQKPAANDEPSNLSRNGHEPPKNGYDGLAKRLPGFLKRIYDYYEDTAYKPYPPFGIATALSAMSTLTQNHYFVDGYNLGINLYHILVAHTGFGKEGPRAAIKNLLHECELSGVIAESIASGPAIKKRLSKDRTLMLMADEIGSMLASTVGKNADQHQTGVLKELRTLYSSATTVIGGHHYADSSKDIPPIAYPFVNLLGTSTPLQLMDGISLNQIENGLINRLIMIEAVGDPDRRERRRPIKPPEDLVHDLKEFIMRRHNYPQEIQVTSEADQLIRASELYQDDLLKQDSELSGLYGRLNENTIRVAAVLAVAEVPEKPIMTAQHVEWAKQYVYSAAQAMEKSFSDNFYESEIDKQIKKVIKTIRTYKDSIWVPKSHISRETRLSKRHLDEHLSTLMDRELIEERKEAANDKKAGRPTRYFRMLDAG